MIKREWLARVRRDSDALRSLVHRYHPTTRRQRDILADPSLPITAPKVERAAQVVRNAIAREQADAGDPVERFDAALRSGDAAELSSLLSGAWFGVPESTSCWEIPGFAEAVDLLDDPPEPDDA